MSYAFVSGFLFGLLYYCFCRPDASADEYMSKVILDSYNMTVTDLPRFIIMPFAENLTMRWNNMTFLLLGIAMMFLQYIIIIYCGTKMHCIFKQELTRYSILNRKLQKQFFRALIAQTTIPTLLFVLPISPFLVAPLLQPFLKFELNFPMGFMYVFLSFYPPIDTVVFMLIVTEYKFAILGMLRKVLPRSVNVVTDISSSKVVTIAQ